MFEKKCPNCNNKISRKYSYCPYCGSNMKKKEKDGLIDSLEEEDFRPRNFNDIESLTNELGKSMGLDFIDKFPFNQIVKKLSADIEKQFKDIDREISDNKSKETVKKMNGTEVRRTNFPGGFSIQIRMGGNPTPIINTPIQEKQPISKIQQFKEPKKKLTKREQERIAKLPREEPETRIRRLTDKIIYEVYIPGVKSLKDVTVNRLENSIEIKAISNNRAYFKLIPISLPLIKYYLKENSLFLELKPQS